MKKPKLTQPQTPNEVQGRDLFQTPPCAVWLLLPFLEVLRTETNPFPVIWECAAGEGRIAMVLHDANFIIHTTDIDPGYPDDMRLNFLTDTPDFDWDCIVTNPPFSIKIKFYLQCIKYDKPFALLVPGAESNWMWAARFLHGCHKIVPDNRINYLTPNMLDVVCRGESFIRLSRELKAEYKTPAKLPSELWDMQWMFPSVDETPKELIYKWSKAQFDSVWLTRKLVNSTNTETGVRLTKKMMLEGAR